MHPFLQRRELHQGSDRRKCNVLNEIARNINHIPRSSLTQIHEKAIGLGTDIHENVFPACAIYGQGPCYS